MTFTPPQTIRALRTQDTKHKSVAVETVPLRLSDDDESAQEITPDEVLVRVRAVGINPTDAKHALGTGAEDWGSPGVVCGCDGAGDVVLVGSDVKNIKVGDRVAGFAYGTHHPTNGSYAEYVRYRASATLALPDDMSYEQGAALPIPHMTAVQALYMRMYLPPPSKGGAQGRILIWGGGTAVGHHAIQLARLSGLDVVAVASKSNHEALKSLGAQHCVDYHDADVVKQIQSVGKIEYGLDCVVEKGSTRNMIDAMQGGHIVLLLPFSDDDKAAHEANGGKIEMTLAYTVIGRALTFAKVMPFPAMPEDRKAIAQWSADEFPALYAGWKQSANRSERFVGATLREMDRGLEGIEAGFRDSLAGKVRAEKLVYAL